VDELVRAERSYIVFEDATWFCGAVVVEHRYIGPIVGGAIGDGLMVR
jgi:hypothetical protein